MTPHGCNPCGARHPECVRTPDAVIIVNSPGLTRQSNKVFSSLHTTNKFPGTGGDIRKIIVQSDGCYGSNHVRRHCLWQILRPQQEMF